MQVHHKDGIDWDGLLEEIRRRLLQDPTRLEALCEKCHEEIEHKGAKQ